MTRSAERWRSLGGTTRVVLALLVVLVAVNALLALVDKLTAGSQPSGPTSSSLATGSSGYEAWADLLSQNGHRVVRLRQPLDESLPAGGTVVVADPSSLSSAEVDALHRFLDAGGRVVAIGARTIPLLQAVLANGAPRWSPVGAETATPVGAPQPETAGVGVVRASGTGGSWSSTGASQPLLAGDGGTLAMATDVGRGRLVVVADSSVFSNGLLAAADNAQLALEVVGAPPVGVAFDENAHGFGAGIGFGGLPLRWQWALIVGAVAAGLWMWSRAWRFGPPELPGRPLPPLRRRYVEAVATTLSGTQPAGPAVERVRAAARARIARRAGVPPDAADATVAAAATSAGVPEQVVAAVLGGGQTDAGMLAVGRALAWLEEVSS